MPRVSGWVKKFDGVCASAQPGAFRTGWDLIGSEFKAEKWPACRPFLSAVASPLEVDSYLSDRLSPILRLGLGVGVLSGSNLWMLLYVMGQKAVYLDHFRAMRRRSSSDQEA